MNKRLPFQISVKKMLWITISCCIVLASFFLNIILGGFLVIIITGILAIYLGSNDPEALLKKQYGVAFLCGLIWFYGAYNPISKAGGQFLINISGVPTRENMWLIVSLEWLVCALFLLTVIVTRKWINKLGWMNSLIYLFSTTILLSYLLVTTILIRYRIEYVIHWGHWEDWGGVTYVADDFSVLNFDNILLVLIVDPIEMLTNYYSTVLLTLGILFCIRYYSVQKLVSTSENIDNRCGA